VSIVTSDRTLTWKNAIINEKREDRGKKPPEKGNSMIKGKSRNLFYYLCMKRKYV